MNNSTVHMATRQASCLVLFWLLAGLLVRKFHFQLTGEKKLERSPGKGRT